MQLVVRAAEQVVQNPARRRGSRRTLLAPATNIVVRRVRYCEASESCSGMHLQQEQHLVSIRLTVGWGRSVSARCCAAFASFSTTTERLLQFT